MKTLTIHVQVSFILRIANRSYSHKCNIHFLLHLYPLRKKKEKKEKGIVATGSKEMDDKQNYFLPTTDIRLFAKS